MEALRPSHDKLLTGVRRDPARLFPFSHGVCVNSKLANAPATELRDSLKAEWHLIPDAEGKQRRLPTEAGRRAGLSTAQRMGQNGEYTAVYYDANVQRLILDHLEEILK